MKSLTFILILLSISLFAQTPPQIQQRIYVDTSGKIYVNLHQPFYFKVSTSPNPDSKKYLLAYSSTPEIVNPLYFKNEGANVLYTPWAVDTATKKPIYPKVNVEFIVYADGTAPRSVLNFATGYVQVDDKIFFGKKAQISIISKDNLSGIDQIWYSVNGQQFSTYTQPLIFDKQGQYQLKYFAADNVGNAEKVKTFSFFVDTDAPITQVVVQGDYVRNILSPRSKIILDFNDNLSGTTKTFYSLDEEDTLLYTKPLSMDRISEGWHKLVYFSQDAVKNTESAKEFKFYLDKTPPLILEDIIGTSYFVGTTQYLSGNSKLKLTAIDNFSGVKALYYSFDGQNWQLYTEPIPFPKTNQLITLMYYAVDSVGNKSQIDKSLTQRGGVFSTFLDLTPPQINYSFIDEYRYGNTVYLGRQSKIKLWANDSQSGVKQINYQIDTSTNALTYTQPFSILQQGVHKITATAFDNVNNFAIVEFSVTVDTTAPEININFSQPEIATKDGLKVYPATVKVFVSAFDEICGLKTIYVSINGQAPRLNATFLSNLPSGKIKLQVTAIDYLNNKHTAEFQFYVE